MCTNLHSFKSYNVLIIWSKKEPDILTPNHAVRLNLGYRQRYTLTFSGPGKEDKEAHIPYTRNHNPLVLVFPFFFPLWATSCSIRGDTFHTPPQKCTHLHMHLWTPQPESPRSAWAPFSKPSPLAHPSNLEVSHSGCSWKGGAGEEAKAALES